MPDNGQEAGTGDPTDPSNPPGGTQTPNGTNPLLAWARPLLANAYLMYLGRAMSDEEFASYTGPQATEQSIRQAVEGVRTSPESQVHQQTNPGAWGHLPTAGATTTTTTTNGGGGGGGGNTTQTDWTRPWGGTFTAPTLGPGVPETPQFHFTAPTYEQAANEPGYRFAAGEGRRLMEQGAAAKGVLNTGGTLRDVDAWGTNFAATHYNDVYGRAHQQAEDEFAPQMTAYSTQAAANQRSNEWNYSNAWNKYLFDYQAFRNWQNDSFDKYFRTANA